MGGRIVFMNKCSQLVDIISKGLPDSEPVSKQFAVSKTRFNEVDELHSTLQMWCGITLLLHIIWIMKYLRHPRLAAIKHTVSTAADDLGHFLFVFVIFFALYVVMANMFFGTGLKSFSTIGKTIETSFRICVGDFDYDAMEDYFPMGAILFFWTFQAFVVILLFNITIGIVCAAYDGTVSEKGNHSIFMDAIHGISNAAGSLAGAVTPRSEPQKGRAEEGMDGV